MGNVDLHVHSTCSDGTVTPKQLVALAVQKNLSALALTDHDTTDGIRTATEYAEHIHAPLTVIPGIELSAEHKKKEIHIVGLFIHLEDENFIKTNRIYAERRLHRNEEMVENFRKAGIYMTLEDLQEGNPNTVITRAHFAKYLLSHKIVKNAKEAFTKYLGQDCPFYVPRSRISAVDAIRLILDNGGIPILAHPMHYHLTESALTAMIEDFIDAGLLGIEVKYSNHMPKDEVFLKRLAKRYHLMKSGGSDFHGENKPDIALGTGRGNLMVPYDYLETMTNYIKKR